MGRRRFERPGHKWVRELAPIRVARSALGPNNPHRDLFLSQHHSLYLDDVLIPVVELLNHHTIVRCHGEDLEEIEYFHIRLERHSVIYAEGAACEKLHAKGIITFDNCEEYRRLYGEPPSHEPTFSPMLAYIDVRSMLRVTVAECYLTVDRCSH